MPPAADDARATFLQQPLREQVAQIAGHFGQVASSIRTNEPAEAVTRLCGEAQQRCEWAVAQSRGELQRLLLNVQTALRTWREVWPRLGHQQEFRAAVSREAERWSKRLQVLASTVT